MDNLLNVVESDSERHLKEMFECLRFETISALPEKEPEIRCCGEWLIKKFKSIGFENAGFKETGGFPAVYADWLHAGNDKPTIMIYGHYDVQPVDPIEKWTTPPFEPTIRDGRIYGRGTSDDKSQFLTHIFALESIMKTEGKLPVNVKFFLESEEEGGAGMTHKFVKDHKKLLECDAVALSDTAWMKDDIPTIVYALRGIAYFQVNIKGSSRDLHSGVYGGKVRNPLSAMAQIIAKLHDEDGRIAVPGIYDDVLPLTSDERKEFAKVALDDNYVKKEIGVTELFGEKGYTTTERNWGRPAFDVNGMWGGYQGEGGKTVIPSECGFKISLRLVANQSPDKVKKQVTDYIQKICPTGVTVDVQYLHGGAPVMVPIDNKYLNCAQNAVEKAFGKRPILVREGASVPITATFLDALKAPSIMLGFGLDSDNIHSPNESFKLDHFYKGIIASVYFFKSAATC